MHIDLTPTSFLGRLRSITLVLLLISFSVSLPLKAKADFGAVGNVTPATFNADNFNGGTTGDMEIGINDLGGISGDDEEVFGGVNPLESTSAVVGVGFDGIGAVTLTGFISQWDISGDLTLGDAGQGFLTLGASATVDVEGNTIIGAQDTGYGIVSITGATFPGARLKTEGLLTVGQLGVGVINLENRGAMLSESDVIIGEFDGSIGTVSLTDLGTRWTIGDTATPSTLTIGNGDPAATSAQGILNINTDALVQASGIVTVNATGQINFDGGTLRQLITAPLSRITNRGIIRGDGFIDATLNISATGELRNAASAASVREKILVSGPVTVAGDATPGLLGPLDGIIESQGGEMEFQDVVTNFGAIIARNAIMRFRAQENDPLATTGLINNGLLILGDATTVYGNIDNSGGGIIVDLTGGALASVLGDVIFTPGPVAASAGGGSAAMSSNVGTLKLIVDDDSGVFSIFGDLDLGSNATLELDYSLGVPSQVGDTLSLLSANNIVGEFANSEAIADGRYWDIDFLGDEIFITATSKLIDPADYDVDSDIDGLDFLSFQQGFGSTYDDVDFDNWKAWLGEDISPPESSAAFASAGVGAVPEPTTLALLMLGGVLLASRRSRFAS